MGSDDASQRHVLVVEREMITGLALAEDLMELGLRVSGPFISLAEIEAVLRTDAPDVAIVDLAIPDGHGITAARELKARGIPFVVFSTRERVRYVDGEFNDAPWVEKPASTRRLVVALGLKLPLPPT